jgi:hypothetical protein
MGYIAWDVYLNGQLIDTVFFDVDLDRDYVMQALVGHDNYDSAIEVFPQYKKEDL